MKHTLLETGGQVTSRLISRRTGKNTQYSLLVLLTRYVFSSPAGYDDTNDAAELNEETILCLLDEMSVKVAQRWK